MRGAAALAIAAVVAIGFGCGGDGPEEVAVSYFEAIEDGAGETACGYMTPAFRDEYATGGKTCAEVINGIGSPLAFPEATNVEEDAGTAQVEVTGERGTGGAIVELVEDGGEWRVEAARGAESGG